MTFRRTNVLPKADRKGHFDREEEDDVADVDFAAAGATVDVCFVAVVFVVVVVAAANCFASSMMSGSDESIAERTVEKKFMLVFCAKFLAEVVVVAGVL